MKEFFFNIHGAVIRFVSHNKRVAESVVCELCDFTEDLSALPDIELIVLPYRKDCQLLKKYKGSAEEICKGIFSSADLESSHRQAGIIWLTDGCSTDEASLVTLSMAGYLSRFFLASKRNITGIHSASFSLKGRGFLLAGNSGSGKTTMSCFLIKNGFSYLSDEETFIEAEGDSIKIFAFPRYLRIGTGFASSAQGKDILGSVNCRAHNAFHQAGFIINPNDISPGSRIKNSALDACIILRESSAINKITVETGKNPGNLYKLLSLAETVSTDKKNKNTADMIRRNNRKSYEIINLMFDRKPLYFIQYNIERHASELVDRIRAIIEECGKNDNHRKNTPSF